MDSETKKDEIRDENKGFGIEIDIKMATLKLLILYETCFKRRKTALIVPLDPICD